MESTNELVTAAEARAEEVMIVFGRCILKPIPIE